MKNILWYRFTYLLYSLLFRFTKNKTFLKKKLVFGSLVIAMLSVSSCRSHPPHKCYSPVLMDDNAIELNNDTIKK